jgi:hypothetical protein
MAGVSCWCTCTRADIAPSAQRDAPRHPPEPSHPMAAADQAFAGEQPPHLPSSIRFPRLLMEDAHPFHEPLVGLRADTGRSSLPDIVATPTHLQHPTHGHHAKLPGMPLHEPVLHRTSLAKYTAAFFKMSRSSVTRASSRFRRAISVVRALRGPEPRNAPVPRAWNSRCHL